MGSEKADKKGSSGTAVANARPGQGDQGMDAAMESRDEDRQSDQSAAGVSRSGGYAEKAAARQGGFFEVYKPGQGYYTRLGSGVFFGVLILWGAHFAFESMALFRNDQKPWTLYLQYGVPVAVLIGVGLVLYWILCLNHRAVDFFVATEGEMKKVSWSSRREVIGSTKVVIGTVLIMGFILFVVDLIFMMFFNWIGVLKIGTGMLKILFGGTAQ